MKKESKAYSFADQKWDAEMRVELRRQRKASEGAEFDEEKDVRTLLKKAKLSQKQQVKQLCSSTTVEPHLSGSVIRLL